MYSRHAWACAVLVLVALGTAPAKADLEGCQGALVKAQAALARSQLAVLSRCEERIRAQALPPQDCRLEPATQVALAKAAARLDRQVARACGGADRACGGDLSEESGSAELGWPESCPLLGPSCLAPLSPDACAGLEDCLGCAIGSAVDQSLALAYDALAPAPADRTLARCQDAVADATADLHAARAKALAACWRRVGKGAIPGPCPPHTTEEKAERALAAAEDKARARICKACGGSDRSCGGGDDLAPPEIGFAASCPDVTPPGGLTCAAPVDGLPALVDCVLCATAFAADCADAAAVPQEIDYPVSCPQCSPGVEHACYTGPAGTEGVGACQGGAATCADDQRFGSCAGEVTPAAEVCGNQADDDCDGAADVIAASCGTGACERSVDLCDPATPQCLPGEIGAEHCDDGIDSNCNGRLDETPVARDVASIRDFLELSVERAEEGFSPACGASPAICCPGGNPVQPCGPLAIELPEPPMVAPMGDPDLFSFSIRARMVTLQDILVEIPLIGTCAIAIDTSPGATPEIAFDGTLAFVEPNPPDAPFSVALGPLSLTGLTADDVDIHGGFACQLASLGIGFFIGTLTDGLEAAVRSSLVEFVCEP